MNYPHFWSGLATFCALVAIFLFPGYCWVTWLHRADSLRPWQRWPLAFAWSLAVFALAGGPFLWFHGSFANFLYVLYAAWAFYSLLGLVAYARYWRKGTLNEGSALAPPERSSAGPALKTRQSRESSTKPALAILAGYLLVLAALGWAWVLLPFERNSTFELA